MIHIAVAGNIGFETANRLAEEHREELRQHFSAAFFRDFADLGKESVSREEIELAGAAGSMLYFNEILHGGLYGTLWEACEKSGVSTHTGCRVFLDAIPVRQEIVEISERFDLDPLELSSRGAWIFLMEEEVLARHREGPDFGLLGPVPFREIGFLTGDAKRLLLRDGLQRYLTPPVRQQKDQEDRHQSRKHKTEE